MTYGDIALGCQLDNILREVESLCLVLEQKAGWRRAISHLDPDLNLIFKITGIGSCHVGAMALLLLLCLIFGTTLKDGVTAIGVSRLG